MQSDRFASARLVADAVLYEGYVLYPYRASAQKNQLRWQFGVLAPPDYARFSGSERSSMRTEVIVDPGEQPRLTVRIRCLQIQHRDIEATSDGGSIVLSRSTSLELEGSTLVAWDEAIDREIDLDPVALLPVADAIERALVQIARRARTWNCCVIIAATLSVVRYVDASRSDGIVDISTVHVDADGPLLKVTIGVENTTWWSEADDAGAIATASCVGR